MAKKKMKGAASASQVDNSKVFSALTYPLFIVGLIWYLADEKIQKDAFAKYHFKQSLILAIVNVGLWILGSLLFSIIWWRLASLIGSINGIVWLVCSVLGIINVLNGAKKELPVIGHLAEKLRF